MLLAGAIYEQLPRGPDGRVTVDDVKVSEVVIEYPREFFPTAAPTPTPPLIPMSYIFYASLAAGALLLVVLMR